MFISALFNIRCDSAQRQNRGFILELWILYIWIGAAVPSLTAGRVKDDSHSYVTFCLFEINETLHCSHIVSPPMAPNDEPTN